MLDFKIVSINHDSSASITHQDNDQHETKRPSSETKGSTKTTKGTESKTAPAEDSTDTDPFTTAKEVIKEKPSARTGTDPTFVDEFEALVTVKDAGKRQHFGEALHEFMHRLKENARARPTKVFSFKVFGMLRVIDVLLGLKEISARDKSTCKSYLKELTSNIKKQQELKLSKPHINKIQNILEKHGPKQQAQTTVLQASQVLINAYKAALESGKQIHNPHTNPRRQLKPSRSTMILRLGYFVSLNSKNPELYGNVVNILSEQINRTTENLEANYALIRTSYEFFHPNLYREIACANQIKLAMKGGVVVAARTLKTFTFDLVKGVFSFATNLVSSTVKKVGEETQPFVVKMNTILPQLAGTTFRQLVIDPANNMIKFIPGYSDAEQKYNEEQSKADTSTGA